MLPATFSVSSSAQTPAATPGYMSAGTRGRRSRSGARAARSRSIFWRS